MPHDSLKLIALALLLGGAPPARAGDVKGSITFAGKAPELKPLQVTRDQAVCGKDMPDETVEVTGGKLANVVVTVKGAPTQPGTTR
jgi:hypothetical protein